MVAPVALAAVAGVAVGCASSKVAAPAAMGNSLFSSFSSAVADMFRPPYDNELLRAETFMREGKNDPAVALYEKTIPRIPVDAKRERASALVQLGDCYASSGKLREAFGSYQKALESDAENLDAHVRIAQFLSGAGEMKPAVEQASFVLKRRPEDAVALAIVGAAEAQAGHNARAKELLERSITLDPQRPMVAIELAQLYASESQPDAARKVLKEAASQADGKQAAIAWLALGRLEEQAGDKDAADTAYRAAVRVDDEVIPNLRLAQFLQRTARVAEAEQVLRHVDAMRPAEPSTLAEARLNAGRNVDALEMMRVNSPRSAARAIEGQLGSDGSQETLARFRNALDPAAVETMEAEQALAKGDVSGAETHAVAALNKAPNSASTHYVRGLVFAQQDRIAEAKEQWNSAVEADTDYVPARIELAKQNLKEGDLSTAEQHITAVVRDEPANLEALCVFARILLQQRRIEPAIAIAKRAQSVNPTAAEPHIVTGQIGLRVKRYGAAFLEFERAILLSPESTEAMNGILEVYRHGDVTRPVLEKMERVGNAPPVSASLLEVAGRLFAAKGMYTDAERVLRHSLAADPKRATAALALAEVEYARGERKPEAFLAELGKTSGRPFDRTIRTLEAMKAEQSGETKKAIAGYEMALSAGESSGVAANNLAWQYAQQGIKLDRALQLAVSAVEREPRNPAVLDTLGVVQLKRRNYSGAVNVLERAVAMLSASGTRAESAAVYRHLAEACDGAGMTEQAGAARSKAGEKERHYKQKVPSS